MNWIGRGRELNCLVVVSFFNMHRLVKIVCLKNCLLRLDVGQVDDMTADLIISQLLFLDAEDSEKDIKLFINSPGGSVTAGRRFIFFQYA